MQLSIKKISQHTILRHFACLFTICVFLLSITPKQLLHNLSAKHKDNVAHNAPDRDREQINEGGYHCDCNSIVATSPYTSVETILAVTPFKPGTVYSESRYISIPYPRYFYFNLRGPPAIV